MNQHKILSVWAREVIDSRGNPTIEVEIGLENSVFGRAQVPSGASKGQHEALELRDGDPKRYLGKGTQKAVHNVLKQIGPALVGKSFDSISTLDSVVLSLDGTTQKENLGANAVLGVSLAYAQAVAKAENRPLFLVINEGMGLSKNDLKLPVPLMNILNGGIHANNGLEIQEFMIVPHGFSCFSEALRAGCEVFHILKKQLGDKNYSTAVGDEGGFAPALPNNEAALEMISHAIEKAGYKIGSQISLALDVASSSFYSSSDGRYVMGKERLTGAEMIDFYLKLADTFKIVSIEDGLDENDWVGWARLTEKLGKRMQLVGDDLFVTQKVFVEKGIEQKVANAVLIKVNQVGSLKETFETMSLCRKVKYNAIVSHRSGETEDTSIAHLAVGSGCGQIKTGSASRSERLAKYNELLRIEEWAERKKTAIPFEDIFKF